MADAPGERGWDGRPRVSMRLRLTVWVVAIFTLIQWSISAVLWIYQSASIEQVFNERLRERAEDLVDEISAMVPGTDRAWLERLAADRSSWAGSNRLMIDVLRKDGRSAIPGDSWFRAGEVPVAKVLASGEVVHLSLQPVGGAEAGSGASDAGEMPPRVRAAAMVMLGADLEPYVLVVGSDDRFASDQLALVGRLFALSAVLGPLVTAACGWYIAGIAVAPFERLRRLASQLGPHSLDHQLDMPVQNTELARLRDQLEEARVRIRDAFEAQERFLTNVSHELKTPIAVVLAEAQTLRIGDASEHVHEFLASTQEEMQRLGRLVESFLTLARVRDEYHGVRGRKYGANDLAMDAVEHCAKMAEQNKVLLSATLMEEEQYLDASVAGDPDLLRTMLDNLIRNAIRFTPPGRRVDVRPEIRDGWLYVRVRDEGPGIPCDQIATVFNRFRQADNQRSGRGTGHGLGLAIAQGIAELHGGSISAANAEAGGCVFEVRLPLVGTQPGHAG